MRRRMLGSSSHVDLQEVGQKSFVGNLRRLLRQGRCFRYAKPKVKFISRMVGCGGCGARGSFLGRGWRSGERFSCRFCFLFAGFLGDLFAPSSFIPSGERSLRFNRVGENFKDRLGYILVWIKFLGYPPIALPFIIPRGQFDVPKKEVGFEDIFALGQNLFANCLRVPVLPIAPKNFS